MQIRIINFFYLSISLLFTFFQNVNASTIYYGAQTELVTIRYGSETIFRFDDPVQTVTDAERFRMEPANSGSPDYSILKLMPRFTYGKSFVSFILSNGSIVKTQIRVVESSAETIDSIYDFKSQTQMLNTKSGNSAPQITDVDLMKAMLRGHRVSGFQIKKLDRELHTGLKGIKATLERIWTGSGQYNGYLIRLENVSFRKKYSIDLAKLKFGSPNQAIISQVDSELLIPNSKVPVYLRIVSSSSSLSQEILLPVKDLKKDEL